MTMTYNLLLIGICLSCPPMQVAYDCFSVVRVESPHCDPYWDMKTRNPGFLASKACHPIFLNKMLTSPRQSQIALTDNRKKKEP